MKSRCDILLGIYAFGTGGAEVLASRIAILLQRKGFRVAVLATHGDFGPISNLLKNHNIDCYTIRSEQHGRLARRWLLFRIFRRLRPALFHAQHFSLFKYCYLPAQIACAPVMVATEHTDYEFTRIARDRKAAGYSLARADAVTVVHSGILKSLRDNFTQGLNKVVVIPNGVDVDTFQPSAALSSLRQEIGAQTDDVLIGFVGRLHPQKNVANLISAMPALIHHCPNARLAIIGDGPEEDRLRRLAADLGVSHRVAFAGRREDIASVLASIDIFALPSLTEGLPLALLEAMASGCPAVATRVGATPLILTDEAGIIVDVGDIDGLSNAFIRLAENPNLRAAMGTEARRIAETDFVEQQCLALYLQLFESLASFPARTADVRS